MKIRISFRSAVTIDANTLEEAYEEFAKMILVGAKKGEFVSYDSVTDISDDTEISPHLFEIEDPDTCRKINRKHGLKYLDDVKKSLIKHVEDNVESFDDRYKAALYYRETSRCPLNMCDESLVDEMREVIEGYCEDHHILYDDTSTEIDDFIENNW
jgi:hypothetical protein